MRPCLLTAIAAVGLLFSDWGPLPRSAGGIERGTPGQVRDAMAVITEPRSDDTDVMNATLRLVEVAKEAPDEVVPDLVAAAADRRW
jgi:hypothetical protein